MCRNIKILFNFSPGVSDDEINAAALQYVRKISGFTEPSKINEEAFSHAISHVSDASRELLRSLVTSADPRNREAEARKAHERALKRFGTKR